MAIHPTAVVDPTADIHPSVEIGAYAIVEGDVEIGEGTRLLPHAFVGQYTRMGMGCEIHPFAVVGHVPQDLKYYGSVTYTRIGDETVVREGATIHRGAIPDATTVVGKRCLIMATSHIGHDCVLGDQVKVANSGLLAGHVIVQDRAFISGNVSVHQFVHIGELAMIGGGLRANSDVLPFMMIGPEGVVGPNVTGMRRAGMSAADRHEVRFCHKVLFRSNNTVGESIDEIAGKVETGAGKKVLAFLQAPSKRGFMGLKNRSRPEENDSGSTA